MNNKVSSIETQILSEETKDDLIQTKLKHKHAVLCEAFSELDGACLKLCKFFSKDLLVCLHSFEQYLTLEEKSTAYLTELANKKFDQVNVFFLEK